MRTVGAVLTCSEVSKRQMESPLKKENVPSKRIRVIPSAGSGDSWAVATDAGSLAVFDGPSARERAISFGLHFAESLRSLCPVVLVIEEPAELSRLAS
jgi:hypothetical protein